MESDGDWYEYLETGVSLRDAQKGAERTVIFDFFYGGVISFYRNFYQAKRRRGSGKVSEDFDYGT